MRKNQIKILLKGSLKKIKATFSHPGGWLFFVDHQAQNPWQGLAFFKVNLDS